MPEEMDILTVAREFLSSNKLEPWEEVALPVSALRRIAQAAIDLSSANKALEKRLEYQLHISDMLTGINEKLQEDRTKLRAQLDELIDAHGSPAIGLGYDCGG